ncbi:deoxynucleoside triphosphate triphosphohydrolase SAMHD1-like isoform X2 [Paramacrobiotus metropolitanus]|uniref:deoxynucleoside triphosphate triphosphohydrolase SAMHD1-like isoform X2 n=1 Tax=Paramacrobiotus metropolitanus TaxID=2943436 RepID=UPI002445D130|nr:deoxynucleoside triphosphate triphosphohydrolase SAMHD1-like isoform X2 [Paramacrobiotus metropolitanus]
MLSAKIPPDVPLYADSSPTGSPYDTVLDAIHGEIAVHPLLWKIIDTEAFQRLRYIRMLGPAYFVFPGGNHTRFEHCIGVAFLAGEFVTSLRLRQPELKITKQDALAVMIAGMCHDLGHGPLSHTFELFMDEVAGDRKWKHEEASLGMFRYLLEINDLKPIFKEYGLYDIDIMFIEELIVGERHVARPAEKAFLYEIVANKRNGIDVDRWDYFLRDCHHTNVKMGFENYQRFIRGCRAICFQGEWQICFRDKLVSNVKSIFHTRCELHRILYQQKTTRLIEQMVIDALTAADSYLKFSGDDGKLRKLSDTVDNMAAYLKADDTVVNMIRSSDIPELESSRRLLRRIFARDLYRYVGRSASTERLDFEKTALKMELARAATAEVGRDVNVSDIIIIRTLFDYGMKNANPFSRIGFFSKTSQNQAKILEGAEITTMLPANWQETAIHVYYTKNDVAAVDALKHAFHSWLEERNIPWKTRSESVDELEKPVGLDGLPDTVGAENYRALRACLERAYKELPQKDDTMRTIEDVLRRLDQHEANKNRIVPGKSSE